MTSSPSIAVREPRTVNGPVCSILFEDPAALTGVENAPMPEFFGDLNLDQVVATITAGWRGYHLDSYFNVPLRTVDAVHYRQDVFTDLESPAVVARLRQFAEAMRGVRAQQTQAGKLHHPHQQRRWLLEAAHDYGESMIALSEVLSSLPLNSFALTRFREFLAGYVRSAKFTEMTAETTRIRQELASIRYTILIKGSTVVVDDYRDQQDYSAEVLTVFDRFRQGSVRSRLVELADADSMNHVEGQVLDRVAMLNPEAFSALQAFCHRYPNCIDVTVATIDREVQFYLSYVALMDSLTKSGLRFCRAGVSRDSKSEAVTDGFDLALAIKLAENRSTVVVNDVELAGDERIIVVSGPNQGGKTTFSRMFGQVHYLASLGLPVPARSARLFLPDRIFTHYEREEDLSTGRGKLEDELVRMREILDAATSDSLVVMNEIFTSTTLEDAIFLGTRVMRRLAELDLICLCVTFIDELASVSPATVTMASTIVPDDPAQRTFKIIRKPVDGLAYAVAIAQKYGLTYPQLVARLGHDDVADGRTDADGETDEGGGSA